MRQNGQTCRRRDKHAGNREGGSVNLTLKWDGESGDGKGLFVVSEQNDGWRDLRIEVDADDCDSDAAREMMQEVIDRCNAANGAAREQEGGTP